MSAFTAGLALTLLGLLFVAPWVVYPALLRLVPRRPARGERQGPHELPRVSVLIPAHNEGETLERKLANTLGLEYPRALLEVIVCSDGSSDRTDAIAAGFAEAGVKLLRNEARRGKAETLNRLVREASGDLLLLTDASALLTPGSLMALVDAVADPKVGVACARYEVRARGIGDGETEAGYWSFESRIRSLEADRDVLLGASGAAYLIRRALMPELPADVVNDDYVVPLSVRVGGHRVAYVHEAVASDEPTECLTTLYHRWVRIAYGNWQMLWRHRGLFVGGGRLSLPLMRKALRTVGPLLLLAGFAVVVASTASHPWLDHAAVGAWALLGASVLASLVPNRGVGASRPFQVARLGLLAQLAYLNGTVRFALGRRHGIWRRGPVHEPVDPARLAPLPLSVRVAKRALDIALSAIALLLLWPVMLIVAIAIKIDSRGPVLYRQTRMRPGKDGRPTDFAMLKFRSMVVDAEARSGPVWASKDDDRITRVGRFIRKHRIDELPQFVNILKGDMSLVGPRPERGFIAGQLEEKIPGYNDRHMVLRPGLTGWAQVQCGYDTSLESAKEKVMHDLVYIAHLYRLHTYLKMELKILFKTFGVVISGKGAH